MILSKFSKKTSDQKQKSNKEDKLMFDKIKDYIVTVVEDEKMDVAEFIGLIEVILDAIFGFIKKEEEIA